MAIEEKSHLATPTITPARGPAVKKKVTYESVVDSAELPQDERKSPDFWTLIESLTPQSWIDGDYRLAIIREDPKPSSYGGMNTLEQCQGVLEVRPGVSIPLSDREDIQIGIKQKYGGRAYRLILKKGRERITEGKCINEAPPKYPDQAQPFGGPLPNAPTETSVAAKAIDAMANQQPDAVRLAMEVLRSASEIVMRQATPPASQSPATDLLDQELKRAMIQKFLAPPTDPVETILKYKELFQPPAKSSVQETLELIGALKTSGLVGGVAGKSSLLDLGAQVLPQVAQLAVTGVHEWRLGMEAAARGPHPATAPAASAPIDVHPQPPAAPQPQPATNPGAQPMPPQNPNGAPSIDWVQSRIATIVKDIDYTVDEAVEEVLSLLYNIDPAIVTALLNPPSIHPALPPGEEGLLKLFQNSPPLQVVPVNPRLTEFIKKFVVAAKESESQRLKQPQADAAKPTPSA